MAALWTRTQRGELSLTAGLLLLAVGLWVWAAQFLPLDNPIYAFDWRVYYWGAFKTGWPTYQVAEGIYNPPWTLLMLLPLRALPFNVGWALFTLLTTAVLILAVPRLANGRIDVWLTLALLCSHWTLRQLVDGNLAGLIIAGYLFLLIGWRTRSAWQIAAGILLVTAKYQEAWLTLLVLGGFILRTWPVRRWWLVVIIVAGIVLPSMLLLGAAWWQVLMPPIADGQAQFLSSVDPYRPIVSLAALQVISSVPEWLRWGLWLFVLSLTVWSVARSRWEFSPSLAGCLLTASVLLSPYASGMSLATVLAIGVVPLARRHPITGWALLAFSYGPTLTRMMGLSFDWPHVMQMAYLLAVWCALALHHLRDQMRLAAMPDGERRVGPLTDQAS